MQARFVDFWPPLAIHADFTNADYTRCAANNVERCASIRSIEKFNTKNFRFVFLSFRLRERISYALCASFNSNCLSTERLSALLFIDYFFSVSYWRWLIRLHFASFMKCIYGDRFGCCSGGGESRSISSFRMIDMKWLLGGRQHFEHVVTWNSSKLPNNAKANNITFRGRKNYWVFAFTINNGIILPIYAVYCLTICEIKFTHVKTRQERHCMIWVLVACCNLSFVCSRSHVKRIN